MRVGYLDSFLWTTWFNDLIYVESTNEYSENPCILTGILSTVLRFELNELISFLELFEHLTNIHFEELNWWMSFCAQTLEL